jgi:chorismate lyase / 3-hydroxybenzoate synthase
MASDLSVIFDGAGPSCLRDHPPGINLAIPALHGPAEETWQGGGDIRFGCELEPTDEGLETATERLYARLLRRAGSEELCRIWNYVPDINAPRLEDGLENYRAFSRARARSFETAWGAEFTRRLPAASAVGGAPGVLAAVFATASVSPVSFENPEQIPAYHYPQEHGPRSPSFSRGTRVTGEHSEWVFLSGTAAIKGHQTVAPGCLEPQLACTVNNLQLISQICGSGADVGRSGGWRRRFKVYLRHAHDLTSARDHLHETLLQASDDVIWLLADICRADLEIEIEATLSRDR